MITLGFSTGYFWQTALSHEQKNEKILAVQNEAIELGLGRQNWLAAPMSKRALDLAKQFRYRSIHALSDIRYPSPEAIRAIPVLLNYAEKIDAHTINLHPDRVDDFGWVNQQFGSLLAYENLDALLSSDRFAVSPDDMKIVFEQAPQARFVLDVNHIFTWDKSLQAAQNFFEIFKGRLAHYHLSGFGGTTHQCLFTTHEDVIITGIQKGAPIILESVPEQGWVEPRQEYDYVLQKLSQTLVH